MDNEFDINNPNIILNLEKLEDDMFQQNDAFVDILKQMSEDCQMNLLNRFNNILMIFTNSISGRMVDINKANIENDFFVRNKVIANDKISQINNFLKKLDTNINDIYKMINNNIMDYLMNLKVMVALILQLEAMIKEYNEKGTISVDTYRFFGLPENDPTYDK